MPQVALHGFVTNTHSSYAPGSIIATASNFTVANLAIARVGDQITPHPHPKSPPHVGASISAGAGSFTVGGKAVARKGDGVSCGAKLDQGQSNFTVG